MVIDIVNRVFHTPITLNPKACVLGYLDEEAYPLEIRTLVNLLLFLAHKLIALKWLSPHPPTLEEWHTNVNMILIREQYIY